MRQWQAKSESEDYLQMLVWLQEDKAWLKGDGGELFGWQMLLENKSRVVKA